MDLTVLNLAVPALSADLQPTSTQLLWIVDIYGFLVAGALITMGDARRPHRPPPAAADRRGRVRRRLDARRVLDERRDADRRPRAARHRRRHARAVDAVADPQACSTTRASARSPIGVWITSYSAGAAIGPLVGGALLEFFWWGSVFLLGVPVMALLLIVGPRLLPEYRDPDAGRARPAQRGALAGRGAGRDLRPQAARARTASAPSRWRGSWPALVARRRVRAPPARPRRPADRPQAVPPAGVHRRAGDATCSASSRSSARRCSSRSTCSRCSGSRRWRPGCGCVPGRSASSSARC